MSFKLIILLISFDYLGALWYLQPLIESFKSQESEIKKYKSSKLQYTNFSHIIEPTKTKDKFEKDCLIMEELKSIDVSKCVRERDDSKKNILFVGDSLAHNLHNGFISYENNISTSLISATGCPPYLVIEKNNYLSSEKCTSVTKDLERVETRLSWLSKA